ncbi:MAG: hypothetical protein IJS40_04545 [Synergistaceae bacterium]|nr:hypothetical protein [Synergistaceae bacterium]
MSKKKFIIAISFFILLLALPVYSLDDDNLPDTATLSANRMRFDATTGDFLADGNVTIQAGDLNVEAPVGSGNVDRREVNFDKGITASGKWQGDKINLRAGQLALSFNDVPTCNFLNGVRGGYGPMKIDSDALLIVGFGGIQDPTASDTQTRFVIANVRNLEDSSQGLTFSANSVEGVLINGEVQEMTADKKISIKGKPKAKGDSVSLKGDHAVYSLERGSVVVSGHVVAVQGGRTLKSDSVVYFPGENRVEALGGLTREKNGVVSMDRAEITIDLSRENVKINTPKSINEELKEELTIKTEKPKSKNSKTKSTSTSTTKNKKSNSSKSKRQKDK